MKNTSFQITAFNKPADYSFTSTNTQAIESMVMYIKDHTCCTVGRFLRAFVSATV